MPALREAGCEPLEPEGTFYIWCRWPKGDPKRHWTALADRDVFVLPGTTMDAADHFRISLTASDAMVERALAAFHDALRSGARQPRGSSLALTPADLSRFAPT